MNPKFDYQKYILYCQIQKINIHEDLGLVWYVPIHKIINYFVEITLLLEPIVLFMAEFLSDVIAPWETISFYIPMLLFMMIVSLAIMSPYMLTA